MNKNFLKLKGLLLMACILLALPISVQAQELGEPLIEFKTAVLQQEGQDVGRTVTIFLGGYQQETDYIDFDCGNGVEEHELAPATIDASTGSWKGGTSITCNVTEEGLVRIWGDAANIAVIRFDGCYITDLKMQEMPNLYYLNLDHNLLHELDLSNYPSLSAISVSDNPFDRKPLKIGDNKPKLMLLEIGQTENLDQSFNLSDYPEMVSFDAYANKGLRTLNTSGCPKLQRLSIDGTNVQSLDLSKNPTITILNISDTGIKEIDLSNLTHLQQFYADHQSSSMNTDAKLTKLDVTKNEKLVYLFASGNLLTDIDLSHNRYLQNLYLADNKLTGINLDNNPNLVNVILRKNNMDFATLPLPGEWNQYDYNQNNMPIAKTIKVGDEIDFSQRVLREGSTTICGVFMTSEDEAGQRTPLSEEYYTYADGKITFLQAPEDSVYIAFQNDKFPALTLDYMPLRTDKFMVKTPESFGQDDITATLSSMLTPSGMTLRLKVGMHGASAEHPKTFYLSDAQGNKQAFKATSEGLPEAVNVEYTSTLSSAYILVPQDEVITALEVKDQTLTDINISKARSLGDLRLMGTGLYSIDLGYNRNLRKLVLTGNHFSTLNIRGVNDAYQKTLLTDINLSNNDITEVKLNDMGTIRHLNLAGNQLTELSLKDADNILTMDLSNNNISTVNLSYCTLMTDCNLANNAITSLVMPAEMALVHFDCSGNGLSFATLPVLSQVADYTYAPQDDVTIATKAPGVDLQAHNLNGQTNFVWKKADGTALTADTDYTITDGMTRFLEPVIGQQLHCEMTNPLFPALTMRTTAIEAAAMPSYCIGSFTTTADSEGTLILRATAPTIICVDWRGGGVGVESYNVTDELTTIPVTTHAGSQCSVYAYEPNTPLYVFSTRNIKMADVDLTNMNNLVLVNLTGAGISEVKLPASNSLRELILDSNNIAEIDLSRYASQLVMISMNNNQLTSFDASAMKELFSLNMANNKLTSITLANPNMYNLELSGNALQSIDLSRMPALSQVFLSHNSLERIDLSAQPNLVALHIDYNRFRLSTLPLPKSSYASYQYANQANIDVATDEKGVVDLSSEALVGGTPTTFRWFIDMPYYSEETGELEGEELYYDDEVFVKDGKSQFTTLLDNVVCAMLNEQFPSLTLYTNPIDIKVIDAIEGITADAASRISLSGRTIIVKTNAAVGTEVFSAAGQLVARAKGAASITLPAGVYVVKSGDATAKVLVK